MTLNIFCRIDNPKILFAFLERGYFFWQDYMEIRIENGREINRF